MDENFALRELEKMILIREAAQKDAREEILHMQKAYMEEAKELQKFKNDYEQLLKMLTRSVFTTIN